MHEPHEDLPAAAGSSNPSHPDLSGLRILIADDNAVNRFILSRMLDRAKAISTVVSDGREAVDAWKSQQFDLALLDISMPNMDGLAALGAIQDHETSSARPPPVALAVTAHTMGHEMDFYLAAGFSGIVPKPLRMTTLYEEIRSALAARDRSETPRRQAI